MKTTGSLSGTTPRYYQYKNEKQRELGHKITNAEFEEKYLSDYLPKNSLIAKTDDGGILSIFDPVLCELMYTWFTFEGAKILDPFAGGSVRGVVASMLGRKYTGVDLRQSQIDANEKQRGDLLNGYQEQPRWICGDSMKIKELAPGEYDFVFSCPPYFDLEKYSDDENDLSNMDYDKFIESYRDIIKNSVSMLKDNRFACFVVGDVRNRKNGGFIRGLIPETIRSFEDAGASFYNEIILINCAGSMPLRVTRQFQLARKVGHQHQNVLVFYKGNPKEIHKIYGDVEINEEVSNNLEENE